MMGSCSSLRLTSRNPIPMTIIGDMSVLNNMGHTKYCYYVALVDCYVIGTMLWCKGFTKDKL